LPEVAGGAAVIFDPLDTEAIASAIEKCLTDPSLRIELIDQGFREAAKYTWKKSALQLSEIYNLLTTY
jgi:glycosyltransferase involved in cell wall biosynthesis